MSLCHTYDILSYILVIHCRYWIKIDRLIVLIENVPWWLVKVVVVPSTIDDVVKWLIHSVLCLLITYILSGRDRITYLLQGKRQKVFTNIGEKSVYMRQNVIEIGGIGEKKRLYVTKWHKKRRGDTNPHYMQYSSKKIIKNFFIILFYTIAPLIILYYV